MPPLLLEVSDSLSSMSVASQIRIAAVWWMTLSDDEIMEYRANGWSYFDAQCALLAPRGESTQDLEAIFAETASC